MIIPAACGDIVALVLIDDEDERLLTGKLSIGSHGYAQMWDGSRVVLLHRVVMGLVKGDGRVVDHVDGHKLDCRKSNLRVADVSVNTSNCRAYARSGYRGVYPTQSGRWEAKACLPNRGGSVHLGTFDTREEAAEVVHAWRLENQPGYVNRPDARKVGGA